MTPDTADRRERFLALVEEHRLILFKVARAYGRRAAERDDIAQEIVAQLWRAFPRFDAGFRFSTWMYRIALNVAISWRRRERTQDRHLVDGGETMLEIVGAADAAPDENLALLYAAIERLDDLNKALAMLYLDGQSHAEIAEVLGITQTNVATRIGRMKDKLRAHFRAAGHL